MTSAKTERVRQTGGYSAAAMNSMRKLMRVNIF